MAKKKRRKTSKNGPVEEAVDKAIRLYDIAKNPPEALAKELAREVARKADETLRHRNRSLAAIRGWVTRRERYGYKGHR